MQPREFARRAFTGELSSADIEHEVAQRWRRGDFLFHLGPSAVPPLAPALGRAAVYDGIGGLSSELLFGTEGEPGCLLTVTPPQPSDEGLRRLLVRPHVHRSHHVALITDGEVRVLVVRELRGGPVLIDEPVARGSLILCPAEAPHTFVTRRGFVVASLHARFPGAECGHFSQDSDVDLAALPRLAFDEFRRQDAPGLQA